MKDGNGRHEPHHHTTLLYIHPLVLQPIRMFPAAFGARPAGTQQISRNSCDGVAAAPGANEYFTSLASSLRVARRAAFHHTAEVSLCVSLAYRN